CRSFLVARNEKLLRNAPPGIRRALEGREDTRKDDIEWKAFARRRRGDLRVLLQRDRLRVQTAGDGQPPELPFRVLSSAPGGREGEGALATAATSDAMTPAFPESAETRRLIRARLARGLVPRIRSPRADRAVADGMIGYVCLGCLHLIAVGQRYILYRFSDQPPFRLHEPCDLIWEEERHRPFSSL